MIEPIGSLTFEKALEFTHRWSSSTAYEDDALLGLWTAATLIQHPGVIVEVGCEYGRSSSLLAQVAKEAEHRLTFIDPFVDKKSGTRWTEMMMEADVPFELRCCKTQDVSWLPSAVNLVHIDGDHSAIAIARDCAELLWRVVRGGLVCFHDYDHPSLPDVKPTVDAETPTWAISPNAPTWEFIGDFGTCHVVRRK